MNGTAKKRTDTSIDAMRIGRISTARPIHSRRPAREVMGVSLTAYVTNCC